MKNIALIIAGGVGARTHQDIPKQFINVYDKPIIIYTLESFQKHQLIDAIEVVCLDGWHDILRAYAAQFGITKLKWVRDIGYLDFVRYWGYDIQGAVYQEIVRQNTGQKLPFYIAGISKETTPNIEVIHVNNLYLNEALNVVMANAKRVHDVKSGKVQPDRCECCDYCRETKVLKHPIGIQDLVAEI